MKVISMKPPSQPSRLSPARSALADALAAGKYDDGRGREIEVAVNRCQQRETEARAALSAHQAREAEQFASWFEAGSRSGERPVPGLARRAELEAELAQAVAEAGYARDARAAHKTRMAPAQQVVTAAVSSIGDKVLAVMKEEADEVVAAFSEACRRASDLRVQVEGLRALVLREGRRAVAAGDHQSVALRLAEHLYTKLAEAMEGRALSQLDTVPEWRGDVQTRRAAWEAHSSQLRRDARATINLTQTDGVSK